MKKNTLNVLFSKFSVVLFFLMFLLWNTGQAQSYVNSDIAKTRLGDQAATWATQVKPNPAAPANLQPAIKTAIFEKMILHLEEGATVAQAIDAGMEKYIVLCKDKDPGAISNLSGLVSTFRAFTQSLLSN